MNEMPKPSPVRRYFPVALSGLVYPGVGQFAQKRWVTGAFFLLAFTGLFIWFGVNTYRTLVVYYSFMSSDTTAEPVAVPISRILIPFGLTLLVFLVNVIDAFIACQRHPKASMTMQVAEGGKVPVDPVISPCPPNLQPPKL